MSEEKEQKEQKEKKNLKDKLPKKPQLPKNSFNFYWIYAIIIVALLILNFLPGLMTSPSEAKWNDIETMLHESDVEKIYVVNKEFAEVYVKEKSVDKPAHKKLKEKSNSRFDLFYTYKFVSLDNFERELIEAQADLPPKDVVRPTKVDRTDWSDSLGYIIPILIMVLLWVFIMRRMSGGGGASQIFNIGKSKATLFDKDTNVNITFNDVAGLEEAKVEIKEIVDFLKTPKKYTTLGAKIPKGALLVGPPGTGKTLLAQAVAGEAKVPFFSLSGSDFVEMFVGVGASRVRDLFRQAEQQAPCIVFIDELDALGKVRGSSPVSNDEREQTLNALLVEMDGFESNSGVIIMAATNRPEILDPALLRPGRFDRQIVVDKPDIAGREHILRVHARKVKMGPGVDLKLIASRMPGFAGADLANVVNEAALL